MGRPIIVLAAGVALLGLGSTGCSLSSAEKKYKDVVGGSEQSDTRVELNTASRKRLAALPGLTTTDADRIIASRPYGNRQDLIRKRVLTEQQFEKIKDSVYVEHAKQ